MSMANADEDITLKIGVVADEAQKVAKDLYKHMEKSLSKPIETKAFDDVKKNIKATAAESEKLGKELRALKDADAGINPQFKELVDTIGLTQKKMNALKRESKALTAAGDTAGADAINKQIAQMDVQWRQMLSERMRMSNLGQARLRGEDTQEFAIKTQKLADLNNQMVLYIKQLERIRALESGKAQVANVTKAPASTVTPMKGLSESEDKARVLIETIEQLRNRLTDVNKSASFLTMDSNIQKTINDTNALNAKFEQMRQEVYKVTPTEEFTKAGAEVTALQQKVEKYHATLMRMEEQGKTGTQGYGTALYNWNQAQNSLITQLQYMRQLTASGQDYNRVLWTETEEYQQLLAAQDALNRKLEIGKQKIKESKEYQAYKAQAIPTPSAVEEEGKAAQTTKESLGKLEEQKKRTTKANQDLGTESNKTSEKMGREQAATDRLKSAFTKFGHGVKTIGKGMVTVAKATGRFVNRLRGANKQTGETTKSLKNLLKFSLKYFLGLRSIFILYKRIRSAGVEAYKGLASQFPELQAEVNELKNSFFQLKNSLATMAQPILSYLVPAIQTLMSWLSAAMTALANFFAILTGAKYIYKATKQNKDWAKSAQGAGKAAKEANEDIAEYDNLILIQQDKDAGGGGGAGAADDYAGAWEKVEAESDFAQKLKDAINEGNWEEVGNLFADKLNILTRKLDNWITGTLRPKGKKWAQNIGRILNDL